MSWLRTTFPIPAIHQYGYIIKLYHYNYIITIGRGIFTHANVVPCRLAWCDFDGPPSLSHDRFVHSQLLSPPQKAIIATENAAACSGASVNFWGTHCHAHDVWRSACPGNYTPVRFIAQVVPGYTCVLWRSVATAHCCILAAVLHVSVCDCSVGVDLVPDKSVPEIQFQPYVRFGWSVWLRGLSSRLVQMRPWKAQ